ncbi:MAG: protein phosphatase 2C domain-containing protein [Pseudazoarcus pumilus]|nr:protein phosphatase 2C domain-containing protein [Pseudazoarcus pumilus]
MKFTIFQDSRIGKRKTNQDRIAYSYSRDALLMLVADGMGGHLHGEIAAQIATEIIVGAFQREARPGLEDPTRFLRNALDDAHNAILDYAFDKYLPEAPRTTIVACIVQQSSAWWAHAGDSRLYVLRHGEVVAQTRDHSRVQMLLDQGLIRPEEADRHPERNRIYSCLGGDHPPQIDLSPRITLWEEDVVALCSDGVWGPVGEAGMTGVLSDGDIMQRVPDLLDRAEKIAGPVCDNLSIVAMRWHGGGASAAAAVETEMLAPDHFTTHMDSFDTSTLASGDAEFSDEDIERAITEINSTIRKFK